MSLPRLLDLPPVVSPLARLTAPSVGPAARGVQEDAANTVLGNAFRFLGRPGFAVRSLLRWDLGGVARNVAQANLDLFTGGFLDKRLSLANVFTGTGDLTTRAQRPEASDVLESWGVGAPAHGTWGRLGVDVVGGILTDPLTFVTGVGGGARAGAGAAAAAAARQGGIRIGLPFVERGARYIPLSRRGSFAAAAALGPTALNREAGKQVAKHGFLPGMTGGLAASLLGLPPEVGAAAGVGGAAALRKFKPAMMKSVDQGVAQSLNWAARKLYDKTIGPLGLPKAAQFVARKIEQSRLGRNAELARQVRRLFDGTDIGQRDAMRDVLSEFEQAHHKLHAQGQPIPTPEQLGPAISAEIATRAGVSPAKATEVTNAWLGNMKQIRDELVGFKVLRENAPDLLYVPHRIASHVLKALGEAGALGKTSKDLREGLTDVFTKRRAFDTIEEFEQAIQAKVEGAGLGHLLQGGLGEVGVVTRDLAELMLQRGEAHNRTWANKTLEQTFKTRFGMQEGHPMQPLMAQYLEELTGGIRFPKNYPRKLVHKINRYYKPALTIIWPAFHARNSISAMFQTLLDPALGPKQAFQLAWRLLRDLPVAARLARRSGADVPTLLHAINNPLDQAAQAAASRIRVGGYTGDELRKLAEQGVVGTEHFAQAELIEEIGIGIRDIMGQGKKPRWDQVLELGGRVSRFTEDRARLGAFLGLLDKGVEASEAITRVQRAFVKYDTQSFSEKVLKDLVPFARFTVGTAPVVAGEVLRRPYLVAPFGRTAGSLEGDPSRPPETLPGAAREGRMVPLGAGRFLSSLGLPFEAAADAAALIPTPGRGIGVTSHGVMEQLHPLPKFLLEAGTGRKLYTGRPFGEQGVPMEVLRASPASRLFSSARRLGDERKGSVAARVTKVLTGLGIETPDAQREARRTIEDYLGRRAREGDAGVYERFYARGEVDSELQAALEQLYQIEAAARKKRKASK